MSIENSKREVRNNGSKDLQSEIRFFLETTGWSSEANICQKLKSFVDSSKDSIHFPDVYDDEMELVLEFINCANPWISTKMSIECIEKLLIFTLVICKSKFNTNIDGTVSQLLEALSNEKYSLLRVFEIYKAQLTQSHFGRTILHRTVSATTSPTILKEIMHQLNPTDDFVMKKDLKNRTALHYCRSSEQAVEIVQAVSEDKREEFMTLSDEYNRNALFYCDKSVAEFLIKAVGQDSKGKFILHKDMEGKTVLHWEIDHEKVDILLRSLSKEQLRELLFSIDGQGKTCLHIQNKDCNYVQCLLQYLTSDINEEFITALDCEENTVLHFCKHKNVAEVLLNSVSKSVVEGFIMNPNRRKETVLHKWPCSEVIRYLLQSLDEKQRMNLIFSEDLQGETCLFHVGTEHDVQLLMNFLNQEARYKLLMMKNRRGETVLQAAFKRFCYGLVPGQPYGENAAKLNFIKELCQSIGSRKAEVFFSTVYTSQLKKIVCLLETGNGSLRQHLLNALSKSWTRNFAEFYTNNFTVFLGPNEVHDVIPETSTSQHNISKKADNLHPTFTDFSLECLYNILHTTFNKHEASNRTTQVLESVDPQKREELILTKDNLNQTALHTACKTKEAYKAVELALKSIDAPKREELIFAKDNGKQTVLHCACENEEAYQVIDLVLQSIGPHKRDKLLLEKNYRGETVLHLVIKSQSASLSKQNETVDLILQSMSSGKRAKLIFMVDEYKNTALSLCANENLAATIIRSLGAIDIRFIFQLLFSKIPKLDLSNEFFNFIKCSDTNENTFFTFLVITQNLLLICNLLSTLTLDERRDIIRKPNSKGNDCVCLSMIPKWCLRQHMESFVGDGSAYGMPSKSLTVDIAVIKALHFFCNEYVSSPGSLICLDMSRNCLFNYKVCTMIITGESSISRQYKEVEETQLRQCLSALPSSYVIVLADLPIPQTDFLDEIYGFLINNFIQLQELLQEPNLAGKPKVIIAQCRYTTGWHSEFLTAERMSELLSRIYLPPDTALLSAVTVSDIRDKVMEHMAKASSDLEHNLMLLKQILKQDDRVMALTHISLSLGRRLALVHKNAGYVNSNSMGSALIISRLEGREDAEQELRNIQAVLQGYFQLKTVDTCVLSDSADLLSDIQRFSISEVACNFLILVIASHGEEKDGISGLNGNVYGVHEILANLDNKNSSQVKIVMLQYCRGKNRFARPHDTFERHLSKKYFVGSGCVGSQLVRSSPMPPPASKGYYVPPNYYVGFSTLKDSKALRGLWFKQLRSYLEERTQNGALDIDLVELMTDVAGRVRDDSGLAKHIQRENNLNESFCIKVHPVNQAVTDFCK